jgi:hypothetical protein
MLWSIFNGNKLLMPFYLPPPPLFLPRNTANNWCIKSTPGTDFFLIGENCGEVMLVFAKLDNT